MEFCDMPEIRNYRPHFKKQEPGPQKTLIKLEDGKV